MKYYEVIISKTSKVAGNNTDWQTYDRQRKQFATIAEVKDYLTNECYYKGHKRVKMYRNEGEHCGYIYSWTEKGSVQGDYSTYNMQDWVEVRELKATTVIVTI